ncbi:MAG: hypothetical protein VB957_08555 [Pseudomonadales bacterium]
MMNRLSALLALTAFLTSASAQASSCHSSKMIGEQLSRSGISVLQINVLAGYLEISPSEDNDIHFSGRACTSSEE